MSQDLNTKTDATPTQVFVTFFGKDGNIAQSSGVSNVTKTGLGAYEIEFTNPFSNKYYAYSGGLGGNGPGVVVFEPMSPTQLIVGTNVEGGLPTDPPWVSVTVTGY